MASQPPGPQRGAPQGGLEEEEEEEDFDSEDSTGGDGGGGGGRYGNPSGLSMDFFSDDEEGEESEEG